MTEDKKAKDAAIALVIINNTFDRMIDLLDGALLDTDARGDTLTEGEYKIFLVNLKFHIEKLSFFVGASNRRYGTNHKMVNVILHRVGNA